LAKAIRIDRDRDLAAIKLDPSNSKLEGLNSKSVSSSIAATVIIPPRRSSSFTSAVAASMSSY
jgi:hypothetical protein